MKKISALLVACLLIPVCIFANGTPEAKTTEATQKKTVVRIWTIDRHDATFWTEKFKQYNETNTDNIEVKYEIYSDNYQQAIDMAYQTGEAPDIMKYDSYFYKYVGQDKFLDLMPLLNDEQMDLVKPVIFEGQNLLDGKLYYIPSGNTCLRLFYNKTIFNRLGLKVPTTLEEMVATTKTITAKLSSEGIYGFACNLKSSSSGLKRSFEPMVEMATNTRYGYDFDKGRYDFSKHAPVVNAWKELVKYGFPGCESLDIDPLRSQFAAGKIGMYFSYTHAEPGVYANQFPMAAGQEWGCAYIPTPQGKIVGGSYFNITPAFLFNSEGKHIEQAWKAYTSVLLNPVNLKEHFEQGFGISLLPQVIENADMGDTYQKNPALLKSENDVLWPLTPTDKYPQGVIIEGTNMYDTIGAMIAGQLDVEKGLADLTKRYNKALDQGIKEGLCEPITIPGYSSK
jgi:multiple sugar transport system substrate-binding protein